MFESATFKLTGWYLLILMLISFIFSGAIYQITTNELSNRLERLQNTLVLIPGIPQVSSDVRDVEATAASRKILNGLAYANLIIFISGGIGSYFLARRALRPIQVAHEAQSRFTSDASHELRTPLATMKTEIEVALIDDSSTTDELKSILRSNLEEIEKLTSLSDMLLHLSRLEHDKLERAAINLDNVIRDVMKQYAPSSKRIDVKTALLYVDGNQTAICELVALLIDNALKYSPSHSRISLNVIKKGRQGQLTITNSGKGIPADVLPYVFNRFYRSDNSRTHQSTKGFGIGLAIAKKIVELHSGELSVTSAPGGDTTFIVRLPLVQKNTTKTT